MLPIELDGSAQLHRAPGPHQLRQANALATKLLLI
jgi:hypothetical protein